MKKNTETQETKISGGVILLTTLAPSSTADTGENTDSQQDDFLEGIDNNPSNEDLNTDVNLDLLTEPEGASEDNTNPVNYPNIDKQIDAELGNKSTETNTTAEQQNNSHQQSTNEKAKTPDSPSGDSFFLKPFNALKERLGDDFVIPEDVTQENYLDRLLDVIYEHTDYTDVLPEIVHPQALALHQHLASGGTIDDFVGQYTQLTQIDKMPSKDLVALSLKENFKWDEQKIADTIEKMEKSGYLDIEAEKLRSSYKQSQQQQLQQQAQQSQQQMQQKQQEIAAQREQAMQESLGYLKNVDNIYGVPVSKAEIAEFADDFKYLTTPDPKTGVAPAIELLQSNENLVKVLFMLKKGDDKIRQALTQAKEGAKASFMSKLDQEPKIPKRAAMADSGKINLDLLAAPEQY